MGFGKAIRRIIIEQSKRANVGHIGSALSVADIVGVLYEDILHVPSPESPQRDRFILSKGHAALALYAALHLKGWLSATDLNEFCSDETLLGVHPEHALRGIELSTGSLGFGLPVGVGLALGMRLRGAPHRIFVLMSDAECNEGSVWEAAAFAAHHGLANLVAIVDLNGQQAMGRTESVLNMSPMKARWDAFGWDTHDVDGHDPAAIAAEVRSLQAHKEAPHVLIAHTVFGKGVPFMEGQIPWHYFPMNDEQYQVALESVEQGE